MFKMVFYVAVILAAGMYFWPGLGGGDSGPTTRGDVADRNAATEVARCAKQYSEAAMWRQCLDIVADRTARRPENIARHVNRQEGRTIFTLPD